MASIGAILAIVGLIILIVVGSAVGITYFMTPANSNTSTSTSSSSSTSFTSTSSSSSLVQSTSSSSSTTTSKTTTSSSSTSSTSSTKSSSSSIPKNYALEVTQGGHGPALNSTLTTPLRTVRFYDDGPGSGGTFTYTYTDGGNNWVFSGDFEPGIAEISSNDSRGVTMIQTTCFNQPYTSPNRCGPYHEFVGDNNEENVTELSAVLSGVSTNLTLFSIYAYIPQYNYFGSCSYNVSSTGCSYEGSGPSVSANWALVSSGSNFSNSVAVSFAEVSNGGSPALSIGASTASVVCNPECKYAGGKFLGGSFVSQYTPLHRLTIATDRKSFMELFVDNTKVYSNTTMPVNLNGTNLSLNFYQFTSINNETVTTSWSNFTAFAGNSISVSGLTTGMTLVISGPGGFQQNALGNSNGYAAIDVSLNPLDLNVTIDLNGRGIVSYGQLVSAGAVLKLVQT